MKSTTNFFYRILILATLAAVVMFPIACSSGGGTTPVATQPAPTVTITKTVTTPLVVPPPATTPLTGGQVYETIHIVSPLPFVLVPTGDITITVRVTNINLVDKVGQPAVPGEGHIIYYQDVDTPIELGKPAIPTFGQYATSISPTYTWKNVPIGTRQFSAQVVNNDNTPLGTQTYDAIVLEVVPLATGPSLIGAIGAGLSDVTPSQQFSYNPVTKQAIISVTASNFTITDKIGGANQPGQGHYIYYMDGDAPTTPGKIATTAGSPFFETTADYYIWDDVSEGPHTFSVQLVNNDSTPLVPPVVYKLVVNVTSIAPPPSP